MSALTPPTLAPGAEILGQYVLRQRVGQGMGGETWRASPLAGGPDVAIKVVQHGGLRLRQHRDLIREAGLLRDLDHPHVVPYLGIVDFPGAGATFLIVAWAAGGNLGAWMTGRGRLPTAHARALAMQLCDALGAAHAAGILHRDLKPENVLLREAGSPLPHLLLADFGISQRMAGNVADVTRPAGSPGFTAPECWQSGAVTAAADVYSLGALLLTFVRGTPPPLGDGGVFPDVQRLALRVDDSVEADARPLAHLGIRMLAVEPGQRPTLDEVRAALVCGPPGAPLPDPRSRVPTVPTRTRPARPSGPTIVPALSGRARLAVFGGTAVLAVLALVLVATLAWWGAVGGGGEASPAETLPASEPTAVAPSASESSTTPPLPSTSPPGSTSPSAPPTVAASASPSSPVATTVGTAPGAGAEAAETPTTTDPVPSRPAAAARVPAVTGGPVGELRVGVQSPGGFPADVRLVVTAPGVPEASSTSSQLTVRGLRAGAVGIEVRSSTRSLAAVTVQVPEGEVVRVLCNAPEADFSGLGCAVRVSGP